MPNQSPGVMTPEDVSSLSPSQQIHIAMPPIQVPKPSLPITLSENSINLQATNQVKDGTMPSINEEFNPYSDDRRESR